MASEIKWERAHKRDLHPSCTESSLSEEHCSISNYFPWGTCAQHLKPPSHFCSFFLCTNHSLHTMRPRCLCFFPLSVPITSVISSLGHYIPRTIMPHLRSHTSLERRSYLGREPVHILIIINVHRDVIHLCNPDKPVTLYKPVHTNTHKTSTDLTPLP